MHNDNIRADVFSPGVAYAKSGRKPSTAKEFYGFSLSVIGDVANALKQNKLIIAPSSTVRIFETYDNLRDLYIEIMDSGKALGVIKRVRTNAFDGWLIEK